MRLSQLQPIQMCYGIFIGINSINFIALQLFSWLLALFQAHYPHSPNVYWLGYVTEPKATSRFSKGSQRSTLGFCYSPT